MANSGITVVVNKNCLIGENVLIKVRVITVSLIYEIYNFYNN